METRRYFMHLAYNGAPFFGWQIQPNHPSVQETLEHGLSLLLHCDRISIIGCGRTDTGVHSSCYYAHFDLPEGVDLGDCEHFKDKFNNFLSSDIVIYKIFPVQPQAHARFDAEERTYHYYITTQKDPFLAPLRFFSYRKPNVALMNEAAGLLLQHEDFTSFSKVHTQVNNFICHISKAEWKEQGHELVFTITANRFLRNMVRAIVGTLLDVGLGKLSVEGFRQIIEAKNRCSAGTSMPPQALFLADVSYPWEKILLSDDGQ
ncbi:MAG: tRNA pseudouridine(38-40) synthase TruA [Bacteroidales bacterium]|nr:tRNA pseudouridine(38-40) synthase TruA [Bacteroidales bacterium]